MRVSLWLVSVLSLSVRAAPKYPELNTEVATPESIEHVADYFNLLATKVQQTRTLLSAPVCDLSKAQMPVATPTPLPSVSPGLVLKHVAIGRGTQNYTCDIHNATAAPVQLGALATLFNASCIAALYPDLLQILPAAALQFNLTQELETQLAPMGLSATGVHYFQNLTTPFFNLDMSALQLGEMPCSKNSSVAAPADAPTGQQGSTAVAWLKLVANPDATGDLQEVYRVETAGGGAPKTCEGMPAAFQVQYSAQYWFYEGTS